MPVSAKINVRELRKLMNTAKIKSAATRAIRRASKTALRDMRAEAKKRVRKRKRLKAGLVNRRLVPRKKGSTLDDLELRIDVSGKPISLTEYPGVRQTKRGVSARVNTGDRSVIESAFIATLASGKRGVFLRRGAKRLPIDMQFGSRVSDALLHDGEARGVLRRGEVSFAKTIVRLMKAEL